MVSEGSWSSELRPLTDGWELAWTEPGACAGPADLDADALTWLPARVPGTVAGTLAAAAARSGGRALHPSESDLDGFDWWYRRSIDAPRPVDGEAVELRLDGIATVAEVYLGAELVLESGSMFAAHRCDVGTLLSGADELLVCCRALAPLLSIRRRPRARWRTRLVAEGNLRFHRTMLLGRTPGFAPSPAVVGLWRPVALQRRRGVVLERPRLRARIVGAEGVIECSARLSAPAGQQLPGELPVWVSRRGRDVAGVLAVERTGDGAGRLSGTVAVPAPERWWPHTHGEPALYEVTIGDQKEPLHRVRVGFRELKAARQIELDGLDLRINGVPTFVRGAVWTPADLRDPHSSPEALRQILGRVVDAGMNMLRIPGTATYESDAFHDLCDELGILVWQDFMFANLDYPEADAAFMQEVEREARAELERLAHRPSLAVLCGSSEVAQQVAMLGLDPELARGPLYGTVLPAAVREAGVDAPYVPSAPCGGELPFRTDHGIANYYGVGAYLRPIEDARRARVRFAAECLAFANVPDETALQALSSPGGQEVHHPAWKAGVPRDAGAGWDFDDVRDHYLRSLFDVDPVTLRWSDQERYLELSRAVTGEVMAEVLGEWRRAGSPCAGALVLWLKDLVAGAGWGLLDHRGEPKVAWHHVRRTVAPVAVWTTDEGLGGIDIHVANDRPRPLRAVLRIALYRDSAVLVHETREELELAAHSQLRRSSEAMIGRFVDISWAYRFGPPSQDVVAVTLHDTDGGILSQAFRFPAGRPAKAWSADELGLSAAVDPTRGDRLVLRISSGRFAYGVRLHLPDWMPDDDAFSVEPGGERLITLSTRAGDDAAAPSGVLTALNLRGRAPIMPASKWCR